MKNKKRGFILVGALFLSLFLGIMLSFSIMRSQLHVSAIDVRRASMYAFDAAEAGLESSVNELRRNVTWRGSAENVPFNWIQNDATEQIGSYTVQVTDGGLLQNTPTLYIRVQGWDVDHKTTRVILARVITENPASFFVSTIGDLNIASGLTITGDVLARDVDFAVAPYSTPEQRHIGVDGNVEYVRNIYNETDPDVTITGNVSARAPFTFVGVDQDKYKTIAQAGGRYESSSQVFSGDLNRASLHSSNGVVFVDGDVTISGNVSESLTIVATGNILIEDNLTCQVVGGQQMQIGLLAGGDAVIPESAPNDMTISNAFIVADGGVFAAEGGVGTKDSLNFTGSIAVRGSEDSSAMQLNVFSNRTYNFDTTLQTNLNIPEMSYIVNFITWAEVSPTDPVPSA